MHGQALEGIILPKSPFYHGTYGWMFRKLSPWEPPGNTETEKIKYIADLAETTLVELEDTLEPADMYLLPAGYTYLGQFVDHDITFDSTSSLLRLNDPDKLVNFRTPRFDLDSLYGNGPDVSSFLYDHSDTTQRPKKFLIGKRERLTIKIKRQGEKKELTDFNELQPGDEIKDITKWLEDDLPRNSQGRALIGDSRNDENIIISQVQLAFLKYHNKQVDKFGDFETAQRMTRWHYQWIVIHDLLKKLCGKKLVDKLLNGKISQPFYTFEQQPFIPVEFSAAAYRLHTMVRPSYHLNDVLSKQRKGKPLTIFHASMGEGLQGFRELRPRWTVQWDRFFEFDNSPAPQKSRPVDRKLAKPLRVLEFLDKKDVPEYVPERQKRSLAFRNIFRGWKILLPSGQTVACRMGIKPLKGDDPLWIYMLKEAEKKGNNEKRILGPVGARIVAEVFVGLLTGDPQSYYSVNPNWVPEEGRNYSLRDLLKDARVPITNTDIKKIFKANQ